MERVFFESLWCVSLLCYGRPPVSPRSMGNLQQALVCFEKRLVIAHELGGEGGGKAQAYWELGTLHSQLGNYEQALSCLEHQLNIARSAAVRQLHPYSVK